MTDPAFARFLRDLTVSVTTTTRAWGDRNPDVLVGMAPRRFPVNRAGQILLSLDETLWLRGRLRYGVKR